MRSLRLARGFTLTDLSRKVGYSVQHISGVELAVTTCSSTFIAAIDCALGAEGQLVDMLPAVALERIFATHARRERQAAGANLNDDVKRRAFLGLGLAAVLCPDAAARALNEAEAEHVAYVWSRELTIAPDRQALLPGLVTDLKRFVSTGGPQRGIALLSGYVAMIASSGGDVRAAHRWWRRAQAAANASGDATLVAYVAGQRAMHALFGENAPAKALALADEALAVTSAFCAGRMHALSATARANAVMGRERAAREALATLERTFERLPRDVTREKIAVGGWAEERLHHTRSYAAAFGGLDGGDAAHDAALALYPPPNWRGITQIRLHEAATEVHPEHAVAALSDLNAAQRADRTIRLVAVRTLNACRTRGADTRELRHVLHA